MSYYPGTYDGGPIDLYVQEELQRIAEELQPLEDGAMQQRHVAPDKPRDGLFYADGTDWDPGNGQGLYIYDEGIDDFILIGPVSAHTHLEADIIDGSLLARVADNETISGVWTFTAVNGPSISSASPDLYFRETDQGVDEKHWAVRVGGSTFRIATVNDASPNTGVNDAINITRTGTDVTQITLAGTEVQIDVTTLDVNGATSFNATPTVSGTDISLVTHVHGNELHSERENRNGLSIDDIINNGDSGWYYWGSSQPTGTPGWNYSGLLALHDTGQTIQLAFGSSTRGQLGVRRRDSGTWYDWSLGAFKNEDETVTGQWTFEDDVYLDNGSLLRIYDAGDTDYGEQYHDGTSYYWKFLNASYARMDIDGVTNGFAVEDSTGFKFFVDKASSIVDIRDGYALRIRDAGDTDYVDFSHDGTDLNAAFTGTTDFNLLDGVELKAWDSTNADYVSIKHEGNVGTIGTNANNLKFAPVTGVAYIYTSGTNGEFRVYDADASHYLRMRHDGTDAIFSHSGGSQILCNAQFRANLSGSFGGNLHNFSAYGSQPIYELYETGQASNEARWAIRAQASTFSVAVVNDTGSTGLTDAFTIKRTVTTVDEIDFLSTNLYHNGSPIGGGGGVTKFKSADENVTNSTAMQDDNHLTGFSLTTGKWYKIEAYFAINCQAAAGHGIDMSLVFTNTPADLGLWSVHGTDTVSTLNGDLGAMGGTLRLIFSPDTIGVVAGGHFRANATTGGTFKLQWAQNIANVTATQLQAGSWITITQLD